MLLGYVIAFALHGDWLQIGGRMALDRVLDEAARMTVYGVDGG